MDKEYCAMLKKYNFKAIVDFVSKNQNIDEPKQGNFSIGKVSIASTSNHPMNQDTLIKVVNDSSSYSQNKNGRKTISVSEMREICMKRNSITTQDDIRYEEDKGLGTVFAIAKKQAISQIGESLSAAFQRDYYIFTVIDDALKYFPHKFLAAKDYYQNLLKIDMISGFAMVLLFYIECFEQKKPMFVPPFSEYESFFIEKFGDYVTYKHGESKEFIPYKHCLIKIGKTYYIPSLGALYNRLSHLFYWYLKDLLKDKNIFPNRFGEYFEEYVNSFLKHAVGDNYERINGVIDPHCKLKRPDFEIHKFDHSFIVECKSRLISLDDISKKLYSGYFRKDVSEGIEQLKEYKPEKKDSIRMLVLYEDSFPMIEFFEQAMRQNNNVNELYWIVTIDEFEALMDLNSKEEFDKVIERKMKFQSCKKPISLSTSLRENGVGKQYSHFYLTHIEGLINNKAKEIIELRNDI